MPLTKDEIVERCDQLYEKGLKTDSVSAIELPLIVYISTSAIFGDITRDESFELINVYLNKTKMAGKKK